MAYHLYHHQPCPACGTYYCRFDAAERCPACGSDAAAVYELVPELVDYARRLLVAQGDLSLTGYQPSTPADRYFVLALDLLEAYRHHPHLPPELVAEEAMHEYRRGLGSDERLLAHWQRFFTAVLERWQALRGQPL